MTWRKLRALAGLGMALLRHLVLWPLRPRRGPWAWLQRLEQEELGCTPPEAWQLGAEASRCIGCGLCEVAAGEEDDLPGWLMGSFRAPQEALYGKGVTERLEAQAAAIARVCPQRVDAAVTARLLRERAAMLETDLPPALRAGG